MSHTSRMYQIAERAVHKFTKRHPELRFLKDDLVSVANVAIAERPDATDSQLYSAVNSAIREAVTQELQRVKRSTFRRHGGMPQTPLTIDIASEPQVSLTDWLECCATEFEEAVIRLTWSGYTKREIAQQLECAAAEVKRAQRIVAERFVE